MPPSPVAILCYVVEPVLLCQQVFIKNKPIVENYWHIFASAPPETHSVPVNCFRVCTLRGAAELALRRLMAMRGQNHGLREDSTAVTNGSVEVSDGCSNKLEMLQLSAYVLRCNGYGLLLCLWAFSSLQT
eukprot:3558563-Pleurochrysis_carterae.AAC.1